MPIDTSIYQVPQQPNALQQFGNAVGISNQVEQNKLLRGQQVQQQTQIDTGKLELTFKQLGAFRNMLAPLINKPDGVSERDVTNIATMGIQQKLFTPQQAASSLANFPRNGTAAEKQKFVRDLYTQALSHENQISLMLGPVSGVNTGGGTTLVQTPQMPGLPAREVGALPNTLPPGADLYNEQKRQKIKVTEGQPGSLVTPGGKHPSVAGGMKTAPAEAPLGESEGAREAAGQSGTQLATDRTNAADFTRQVFPLEQAIPKLEALGKTGTGPGTEETNQIKSFLQSLGIPGYDPEKIKNFDESKKYLTDWVMANGNVATNDKLAASFASNANVNISNAAAVDVAKAALALRRMKQAQVAAFEASGLPESQYTRWASQWNAKQDPRVYGFDLMTQVQRQAVIKSIPENKRALFMMAVEDAEKANLIRTPRTESKPKPNTAPRKSNGA